MAARRGIFGQVQSKASTSPALIIYVTRQADGFVLALHPRSRKRLLELEANAPVQRLSIGYDTTVDLEALNGPVKRVVAELLGGVAAGEAARGAWGIVEFRDSSDDSIIAMWDPMNPTP